MFCKTCQTEKSENDFYKRSKSECKECAKKRARQYRLDNLEKVREYDRNRPNRIERCEKQKEYKARMRVENPEKFDKIFHEIRKRYRQKNRDKKKAEDKLDYAILHNKIIRPDECSVCHKKCIPHGHHFDYTKPLEVIWVCPACHSKIHKQIRNKARQIG